MWWCGSSCFFSIRKSVTHLIFSVVEYPLKLLYKNAQQFLLYLLHFSLLLHIHLSHPHINIHISMNTHTHTHTHRGIHACTHVCTHTHTHTHTHTYTYTHAHTQAFTGLSSVCKFTFIWHNKIFAFGCCFFLLFLFSFFPFFAFLFSFFFSTVSHIHILDQKVLSIYSCSVKPLDKN